MLSGLSIRDVVLIDRLDLSFPSGLCVLTGETGAGKSILLDALGLALGSRADQRLVRPGAVRAQVTASFEVTRGHPVEALLAEQDLIQEEDQLVLRRVLGADGRSRAFVNDQPISIGLLRRLGDRLIEIQGQFEDRGLMDASRHRGFLDGFGGLVKKAEAVAGLWHGWAAARQALEQAEQQLAQAQSDETFLRHAVEELDSLDAQPGEEATLSEQRQFLLHREKLVEAVSASLARLAGGDGGSADHALALARRDLERVAEQAGGRLAPALEALDRASAETEEATAQLQSVAGDLDLDPGRLQQIEERYFALRDMARKHRTEVEALPALRAELAGRLAQLDKGEETRAALAAAAEAARQGFITAAEALSKARRKAASALDKAVGLELPALKLERAVFTTRIEAEAEASWGPQGLDRVAFEVQTNPGSAPGPLAKIASGGELSRFMLALKVVLAEVNPGQALVFDEVDSAVGGATAHAVGERLARLAAARQVLVVTHSPQVAARGSAHWRIRKEATGSGPEVATRAGELDPGERREEIARMLSGAEVTDEARAAADRLMGAA